MVTFCLGSARQKREYFHEADGVLVLDNVEVLFCASENGRNYFAFGSVPFGDFTVGEYIRYKCACVSSVPAKTDYDRFRIRESKKLKSLNPVEMRVVDFLAECGGRTDKTLVINLDGTRYSGRRLKALRRLLAAVENSYVCVSDRRFFDKINLRNGVDTLTFGKIEGSRPSFYNAKRLAKKIGAKRVAVF